MHRDRDLLDLLGLERDNVEAGGIFFDRCERSAEVKASIVTTSVGEKKMPVAGRLSSSKHTIRCIFKKTPSIPHK